MEGIEFKMRPPNLSGDGGALALVEHVTPLEGHLIPLVKDEMPLTEDIKEADWLLIRL